jgi:PhzF family phenazine biosynthesis protein
MPNSYAFTQIDAFADRPFAGNSAAVFVLDAWLDDALMQSIALENNLSETAFVIPHDGDKADYELRWFTPTVEVEMCGHATLASGYEMLSRRPDLDRARFLTRKAGVLTVARTDTGALDMDLPVRASAPGEIPGLADELGGRPRAFRVRTDGARDSIIAIYDSESDIRALTPEFGKLAARGNLLYVATAPADAGRPYDIVSRVFVPGGGIDEDPVTGSAHAFLAPYWRERLGRDRFGAFQASARGGHLGMRCVGDRVILTGSCVKVIDGIFHI